MNKEWVEKYSRQIPLFGIENQFKLNSSKALIIGCGGLGSIISENLSNAGINLRIIDNDLVELSNLHRTMFTKKHLRKPKALMLKKILSKKDNISIEAIRSEFKESNSEKLVKDIDVVLDGTDNMNVRRIINQTCLENKIPYIFGSALGMKGMSMTLTYHKKQPCFSCVFPDKITSNKTSAIEGVFNPLISLIGGFQCSEAVKILIKKYELNHKLLYIDLMKNSFEFINIKKNKNCKFCK